MSTCSLDLRYVLGSIARPGSCLSDGTLYASLRLIMSEPRTLRCYEYVNRPYEVVRELLHREPLKLLQRATTSAAVRANSLIANLRVQVAGVEIGVDVRAVVRRVRDQETGPGNVPVTRVELVWEATRMPGIFPAMLAEVSAQPLSSTETQLEIEGSYWPPLGAVGHAIDAAVGHRIAEATVHRLLVDLLQQIRDELPRGNEHA